MSTEDQTTHIKKRQSAETRRETIVQAAITEFARFGIFGTSTQSIADRAGVSHSYLFKLFPSKRDVFLAALEEVGNRIENNFGTPPNNESPFADLHALNANISTNRDDFLLILHGLAASPHDSEIRRVMQHYLHFSYEMALQQTGAEPAVVREIFAQSLLRILALTIEVDWLKEWIDEHK